MGDDGGKMSRVRAKPELGFEGNESVCRREVSVAWTVVGGSFSYLASSWIKDRMVGTSDW